MGGIGPPFCFRVIPTYRVLSHSMIYITYIPAARGNRTDIRILYASTILDHLLLCTYICTYVHVSTFENATIYNLKQICHSGQDSLTHMNKYNVPNNGHTTLQVQFCSSPVPSLCTVPVCEGNEYTNKCNKIQCNLLST